jgi:hypothetical protein
MDKMFLFLLVQIPTNMVMQVKLTLLALLPVLFPQCFYFVLIGLSNAEVGAPMEWYNHPSSLGYDGQDIYYPVSTIQKAYVIYFVVALSETVF